MSQQSRHLVTISAVTLCLGLAACSGETDPGATPAPSGSLTPTPNPTGGSLNSTSRGLTTFPQLSAAASVLTCDHSESDPLVGCYVAETCDPAEDGESRSSIYLLDITKAATIKGHMLFYTESSACQGAFIPANFSALNLSTVSTGTPFMGANGVDITPVDATHSVAGFRTDYISSFHLAEERLCFA